MNITKIPLRTKVGKVLKENMFLKFLVLILVGIILFMSNQIDKPPLVIRINEDGRIQTTKKYESHSGISEWDVRVFCEEFIRRFNLLDSFGVDENIPIALNMMGKDLRELYQEKMISKDLIDRISKGGVRTATKVIKVYDPEPLSDDVISVTLKYERRIEKYDGSRPQLTTVQVTMVLEMVGRTEKNPYGLLVRKYKEKKIV